MIALGLKLPWPPTANTYYRNTYGRTLISKQGRQYRKTVGGECLAQGGAGKHLSGYLSVSITACPPDRRKRDLDNLLKPLLDSLTHAGVWGDDYQVNRLSIERGDATPGGHVHVEICKQH